jgi:hypothetical protein
MTFDIQLTSGEYKSIASPLEWRSIPRLAVLTGSNGAGKSQFLQSLAWQVNEVTHDPVQSTARYSFSNVAYNKEECVHFHSDWPTGGVSPVGLVNIQERATQISMDIKGTNPRCLCR